MAYTRYSIYAVARKKHIKIEPKIHVLFVFELCNVHKIIKNKTSAIKEN